MPCLLSWIAIHYITRKDLRDRVGDDEYTMLEALALIQTLQAITSLCAFFLTCKDHQNASAACIGSQLQLVCPIIYGLLIPLSIFIMLTVYEINGAFEDSFIRIWFIISGVIEVFPVLIFPAVILEYLAQRAYLA